MTGFSRSSLAGAAGLAAFLSSAAAGDLATAQSSRHLSPARGLAMAQSSPRLSPIAGDLAMAQSSRSPIAAPARDGDIAIREELDAARRAGTREAYDLFIARHPDHPLAATARQERERVGAKR